MTTTCDLVLPCRDEAAALPGLLARVPGDFHVVVVDNGSRDGTAQVARRHGATVVSETRAGYGAAVHAGVVAARGEYLAVLDGDGSMDPRELLPLLALVRSGAATMAVGRRRRAARGVWPWHARLGNAAVLAWLRRRTGLTVRDIAPARVCRRQDLLDLGVQDRRFGYPVELLVRARRAGWTIVEHDISYHPRAAGTRSKVSGSLSGTLRAARDFARVLP
ncbi:glycosyltransferase family 2 protein [Phycicoccus endophyticus]|uniref:Glycosyltransferase family 2 protein n=1 Tax=Phycicoccus endophyticus TaxID=1690220 RepID=A0A7G9R1D9_9MICO|nr:glycosyltransferase family 2 protein [Phycicoccus endophyticus]NHI18803.1 glycosyltransferase family 2 protein [Phycicoccus endophyticus]QNN49414.1 glycosyltransferase family 2 protein [Phycicoccus endophyticus]GGL36435.1 glycosyl transferase [Phycicoccus endophyticus]